jgi:hypothetical protein
MYFEKSMIIYEFSCIWPVTENSPQAKNNFFFLFQVFFRLLCSRPGRPHPPPPSPASLFSNVTSPETWQIITNDGMEITSGEKKQLWPIHA